MDPVYTNAVLSTGPLNAASVSKRSLSGHGERAMGPSSAGAHGYRFQNLSTAFIRRLLSVVT
jgi:hypothetical protein